VPLPTLVLAGPTAGGKSELALAVALAAPRALGSPAELITADAYQVYRGMDIGTAKPSAEDRARVPHHVLDLADPHRFPTPDAPGFSVQTWLAAARAAESDIRARGALPIVVGGTHLFIKAFLEGLFEGPPPDHRLRDELHAMDPALRRAELERVDPDAARRIHPADVRRTVRALEVFRQTGTPISALQRQWDRPAVAADGPILVTLDWPTEALNRRINARVKGMMDAGFLEEVRTLLALGPLAPQPAEALGYTQLAAHLAGRCSLDDAVEDTKVGTRRFAKNQRTWLRRLRTIPGSLALSMPMPLDQAVTAVLNRWSGNNPPQEVD
jgi:tRNA dimethylallyltransferase